MDISSGSMNDRRRGSVPRRQPVLVHGRDVLLIGQHVVEIVAGQRLLLVIHRARMADGHASAGQIVNVSPASHRHARFSRTRQNLRDSGASPTV